MRSRMRSRSASATALRIVAVAGDVAAEIDHVQADALLLQTFKHAQRVQGAEHAVELRRDDHVAGLGDREQRLALWPRGRLPAVAGRAVIRYWGGRRLRRLRPATRQRGS